MELSEEDFSGGEYSRVGLLKQSPIRLSKPHVELHNEIPAKTLHCRMHFRIFFNKSGSTILLHRACALVGKDLTLKWLSENQRINILLHLNLL